MPYSFAYDKMVQQVFPRQTRQNAVSLAKRNQYLLSKFIRKETHFVVCLMFAGIVGKTIICRYHQSSVGRSFARFQVSLYLCVPDFDVS